MNKVHNILKLKVLYYHLINVNIAVKGGKGKSWENGKINETDKDVNITFKNY